MQGLTRDHRTLKPGDSILVWILNFRQHPHYCRNPEMNSPQSTLFPTALIGCWMGRLVEIGPRADPTWYRARAVLTDPLVADYPNQDISDFHEKEPWTRYNVYDPNRFRNFLARYRQRVTHFAVKDLLF